jgi:S1-C subfamily serine protease
MSFSALAWAAVLCTANDAVLLQFSSEQCAPCRAMAPAVSRLVSDGYPVQRIDVDQHPEVARQFQVRGVPAFVLVAGGQEIDRVEGATSYDRLARMFAAVSASHQQPQATAIAASPHAASQSVVPAQATDRESRLTATNYSPQGDAMQASVRLRVEDATGYGFGTGTIIDVHDDEALVVTCGHLFRESQGKGRILVDLFAQGARGPVEGQVIAYDLTRDIALVSIRPGIQIAPAIVAAPGTEVRPGDAVFTIGCDKGQDASIRQSQITAVNKYQGKPNFTAAGAPVDGRSGGGLFSASGQLIGICNAADPADDEGLYAGLASIHWQLDQIGQSAIYQRGLQGGATTAATAVAGNVTQPQAAAVQDFASLPQMPAQMPRNQLAGGVPVTPAVYSPPNSAVMTATATTAAAVPGFNDAELVVIVRSKSNPQERSEIYVVDQATPDLLTGIVQAARSGAAQRTRSAAPTGQPIQYAQHERYNPQPVVRGQSQ